MKTVEVQMVMAETLGPRERRWVTARPQTMFKAQNIFYQGPAGTFKLLDIMVGRNTQLSIADNNGLSMEIFANKEPKMNIETCQVAMDFSLLIENVSARRASFECIVFGLEPIV